MINGVPLMKVLNYMNINEELIMARLKQDRTHSFTEVYHAHQGMEFLYIHDGYGRAVIDQSIYEIQPGSLLFIRPFQLHRIQIFSVPDHRYVRSLFVFEPHVLEKYLNPFPSLRDTFQTICYGKDINQVVSMDDSEISDLMRIKQRYITKASPAESFEQKALLLISVLALMKPRIHEKETKASKHLTTVESIIRWIDKHYMEPFELESLAKAVHLSPVYVSKLFSKSAGSSITEYLTARRIQQACWLLKTEELSVKEIGAAVGIFNASYFCQMFKRNSDVSPYQYRKLWLNRIREGG